MLNYRNVPTSTLWDKYKSLFHCTIQIVHEMHWKTAIFLCNLGEAQSKVPNFSLGHINLAILLNNHCWSG